MRALNALSTRFQRRYLEELGYGSGREYTARMIASLGTGDLLLDVGCGEGRLREQVPPEAFYVGLDRHDGAQTNEYANWTMRPDILGDLHALPVADGTVATLALNHVLEHARDPGRALLEVARVLRPGGMLFIDVPFLHEIHHAPHDYFRFTPFALRELTGAAGLETLEIRPSGGYGRALSHLLSAATQVFSGRSVGDRLVRLLLGYPLIALGWLLRKLQYAIDLHDEAQNFTSGYHCVFRKPGMAPLP